MKKRTLPLIILFIGIIGLIFSLPTLQTSAKLGDDYFEDFEGPVIPDWTVSGLWHLENNYTSNWPIYTWIPSSQHYMWYGDNATDKGNYETVGVNSGTLTSDIIDFTVFEGIIRLEFWSWANTENSPEYDLKWVEISPDDGLNWYFLDYIQDSSDWEHYSFDITEYGYSSNARIRFVFDTVDEYNNFYFGWRLDNIEIFEEPGYLNLNIYQGRYALLDEVRWIDFEIWSNFNQVKEINITITINYPNGENETLFYNPSEYIERLNRWFYSIEYKFTIEGEYRVILEAKDYSGGYWWTDCYWEIGPYLEVWIEQGYHALQYDVEQMTFFVENHYNYDFYLDFYVNVTHPSGSTFTIHEGYGKHISEYGKFEFNLEYPFNENGYYQITFVVIDEYSRTWITDCRWEIGPYFQLWIDQEWEASPGQEKMMDFYISSFFDYDTYIDINITIYTPSGEEILYEATDLYMLSWGSWSHSLSYTFKDPGKYDVKFLVIDETDRWWEYWSCWEVFEKFDLWIEQEQDNYAEVGDERWMDFHLKSYFNRDMEVKITIKIIKPNGDEEILYEEDPAYISALGSWDYPLNYVFTEVGTYKVLFILIDDIENEWITDCWWKIEGFQDTDSTNGDNGNDDMISPGFEVTIVTLTLITVVILLKRRK